MKCVILAGGLGTRLSEETDIRPKPMVEIGGHPILWHIMKIYSAQGINDFIVCLGYKGYVIKEFFANYFLHTSDVSFDLKENKMEVLQNHTEPWKITLVDTGMNTQTGGRLKRVQKYVGNETFLMTYGDGVGNVPIKEVIKLHHQHRKYATVTATQPPGRFGSIIMNESNVIERFQEKPIGDSSWINAGFFVLEPNVFNYLDDDSSIWERSPLQRLAEDEQLVAFRHSGFWQPMDTLRDKHILNELWDKGDAPWRSW